MWAVLLAYTAGLLPRRVPGASVTRSGGQREALALLAEALAPPGLRYARLPAAYAPPPVALVRAGVYEELAKLDYRHLYARLAAEALRDYGYVDEARWFEDMVRLREEARARWGDRLVALSAATEFAKAWRPGRPAWRSAACRRWFAEAADEPPATLDEAAELSRGLRCAVYWARLSDVYKYLPHVAVGLTRRWGTGLWETVVSRSREAARELMEDCELAAYVVDAALVLGRCRPRTRHPYREEARGPGLVATPGTYIIETGGDGEPEAGYWGVWAEEPVERPRLGPLWLEPRYVGGLRVLRGEAPPRASRPALERAAEALGLRIGATLREITDTRPGEWREWIDTAVSAPPVGRTRRRGGAMRRWIIGSPLPEPSRGF